MPSDISPTPGLRISAWPKRKNAASNPYQSLLYDAIEADGAAHVLEFHPRHLLGGNPPDILHIHWPDVYLAAGRGWRFWPRLVLLRALFLIAALRGVPVIWTAHNMMRTGQRNGEIMARFFWPWFVQRIDGVLFLTEASKQTAFALAPVLKSKPHAVIPHGHYRPILRGNGGNTPPTSPPRLLFFGAITRYKNAHRLLRAFLDLPAKTAQLEIRGKMSESEPDRALLDLLERVPSERAPEILFDDRFLTDAELEQAIQSASLVVFPYSDVLNSGAAILALSVGCPILASDTALFRELRAQVAAPWIELIHGELCADQLAHALRQATVLKHANRTPDLSPFDWARIAKQTVEFFERVALQKTGGSR